MHTATMQNTVKVTGCTLPTVPMVKLLAELHVYYPNVVVVVDKHVCKTSPALERLRLQGADRAEVLQAQQYVWGFADGYNAHS